MNILLDLLPNIAHIDNRQIVDHAFLKYFSSVISFKNIFLNFKILYLTYCQFYLKMSLESLLGGAIQHFNDGILPSLRDVLRFYSTYWRKQGSDSLKEKLVAEALIRLYEGMNIPTLSEFTIKKKINKSVNELRKVLKFHSKSNPTTKNIANKRVYQLKLDQIFEIRRPTVLHNEPEEIEIQSNEPMEVDDTDDFNGILKNCNVFCRITNLKKKQF